MTDERMHDLVKECGLDWHRGFMPLFEGDTTNRYSVLIDAVQTAERDLFAVHALVVERDALRAERDRLRDGTEHLAIQTRELRVEIDRLRAELAALREQEPYTWEYVVNGAHVCHSPTRPPDDAYDEGSLVRLFKSATPPSVPDGFVLVPKEPTPDMGFAFGIAYRDTGSHYDGMKAAIAAAPKPGDE